MSFDDNTSLNITCQACGMQIYKTVGWFKQPGQSCPHCNTPIDSEAQRNGIAELEDKLAKGLVTAGKQISKALRKIGNIKLDLGGK